MYTFDSRIRYSEVDSECRLTVSGLLNYFQDCCIFQSETLGIGVAYLSERHLAWVLTNWEIVIKELPLLGTAVQVQTWPYEMKAFYGYRNFRMMDAAGRVLAYANSQWALMDMEAGRPVKVPEELRRLYVTEEKLPMDDKGRKMQLPDEMEKAEEFVVPSYFIDSNQHMNNEKYVLIAASQLPVGFKLGEIRVEYKMEAKEKDIITILRNVTEERVTVALQNQNGKTYAVIAFLRKDRGEI